MLLESQMWAASEALDFEQASALRDRIRELEAKLQGKEVNVTMLPGRPAVRQRDSRT
jgi:excinuclease ABC subunit B